MKEYLTQEHAQKNNITHMVVSSGERWGLISPLSAGLAPSLGSSPRATTIPVHGVFIAPEDDMEVDPEVIKKAAQWLRRKIDEEALKFIYDEAEVKHYADDETNSEFRYYQFDG